MKPLSICILILLLLVSTIQADFWISTDWSDPASYDTLANLNGIRQPGNLLLDAPDVFNWQFLFSLPDAQNIYDIIYWNDCIYAATGDQYGDVFKSSDYGFYWDSVANIVQAQWVYDLMIMSDSLLYASYVKGNRASFVGYSDNPDSGWNSGSVILGEKTVYCAIEAENYLYCGTGYHLTVGADIYYSDKGVSDWTFRVGFDDNQILCMFALTPQILLAGTGDSKGYILRSTDGGENWISVDSLGTAINSIVGNINSFSFLCTEDGRVFATSDSGLTWYETDSLPDAIQITSLFLDENGNVYAGGNGSGNQAVIYFSTNNGLTWEKAVNISGRSNISSLLSIQNGFLFAGTNIDASIFRAGYFPHGHIVSKPYYTGTTNKSTRYGVIEWTDSLNGQLITVWVRTAQDSLMSTALPWGMGFPPVMKGDSIVNNPAVNDSDSYIQYYIRFNSNDAGISPLLHEVSIEYTIDTLGPYPVSAIAYDGINQLNGMDDDDYVIITFDEPTNAYPIPSDSVDQYLTLNVGSWGSVDTVYWNYEGGGGGPDTNSAISLTVELNSSSLIQVGRRIYPQDVIKDIWGNDAWGVVQLGGSFDDLIPPVIKSARAFDNVDSIQGLDSDDYVIVVFDQTTNTPNIDSTNIDNILSLSSGHSWGMIDSSLWSPNGETLSIYLDTLGGPSIEVGDTVYPDSVTIQDVNGNSCTSPKVLSGSFGDYGPVITEAIAYDGSIQQNGVDSDDYVDLHFNEETNGASINSVNINTVLKLSSNHSWLPIDSAQWNGYGTILRVHFYDNTPTIQVGDTIYPDSSTITDLLGQPCIHPVVLTGSFNPGVEEEEPIITLPSRLELSINPNPSFGKARISYSIPLRTLADDETRAEISLYDLSGRRIKTIQSGFLLPGMYSCIIDSKDINQGIYFVRLVTPRKTITKKLILLR
jgi:hypothetical protein